jgi:L-iditol 2-dehydrogenase
MSTTGRAAVFLGRGRGFTIRELPIPAIEPDAILIRITRAGICGSDLHIWRGDSDRFGPRDDRGQSLGHEMTGTVAALGAHVKTDSLGRVLKEGDRVVYAYFYPCGRCYVCLQGDLYICPNRWRPNVPDEPPYWTGAYGEYYYLRPGHFVFQVPDDLTDDDVAPLNCALAQVIYSLTAAEVRFGDTVVVQGAGGLGLNAVAVCRDLGAERIIAIDGVPSRLELARRFGADETISLTEFPNPQDRVRRVRELTGGRGADLVADLVGLPGAFAEAVELARFGGRVLEVGNISLGNTVTFDPAKLVWGGKTVKGVMTYHPSTLPKALAFLQRNRDRFPFGKVVSHHFPLDQINEAFEQSEWFGRDTEASRITRSMIVP